MGPCEAFYQSAYQHPIALWLAAALAASYALTRRGLDPTLRRYCCALLALSLLDAWLTAEHVYGLGTLPEALSGAVPLFFVLAGDFRYLLLLFAARPGGVLEIGARGALAAGALTLVVPVFSQAVVSALPESSGGARVLFLVYELAFVGLALALLRWHPGHALAWTRPIGRFVVLYYALWAGSDALLLATGWDPGFALRVVPNVLYYGGLIAVIARAGLAREDAS